MPDPRTTKPVPEDASERIQQAITELLQEQAGQMALWNELLGCLHEAVIAAGVCTSKPLLASHATKSVLRDKVFALLKRAAEIEYDLCGDCDRTGFIVDQMEED